MTRNTLLTCLCTLLFLPSLFAQEKVLRLSLEELVIMAQNESPSVQIAKTQLTNNYWQYQSFLADFKPQIDLEGDLPGLSRSINPQILPDGKLVFLRQASFNSGFNIFLRQDVAATGGVIFARSGLRHIYNFKTDVEPGFSTYLSNPFSIGFFQPLFGFNTLKWDKKIEPVRYDEAGRNYSEELERIALETAALFFEVYIAQLNINAAQREKTNADTLFTINRGRFEVGRIAETELLQVELQVKNADAKLAEAELNLQTSMEQLRNYLGIEEKVRFELELPKEIPLFLVNAERALEMARKNRSETIRFTRQLLEADRDVAMAKANSGPDISINGSFGLSQSAGSLDNAYQNLLDEQRLNIGLSVPLADWGKARSRLKIEESNRELTQKIVAQEKINFEQEILLKVQQFDLIRNRVQLAEQAFEVAQKRENITRKRYLIGKIAITDLNLAIREREEARNAYTEALRSFWLAYYELRQLTLYDFETDQSLVKKGIE